MESQDDTDQTLLFKTNNTTLAHDDSIQPKMAGLLLEPLSREKKWNTYARVKAAFSSTDGYVQLPMEKHQKN